MTSKTNGENEQSSQPQSLIASLPEDILVHILARVPRHDYPALSLVSKQFRSLVTSPEIYSRRSLLRCTENCLYVLLSSNASPSLYILRQKANGSHCLVHISSLLDLPYGENFVAVGSMIYGFGGREMSSSAFSIDCRSHTVQPLPNMPIPMTDIVAGFLNGKVYVFGHCSTESEVMVVFNTVTQMWEPGVLKPDTGPAKMCCLGCMVVMTDKIYIRYVGSRFIYEPKESKWETDEALNSKGWDLGGACVVDDVLYYYDKNENGLNRYDPKERRWGVVKGLDELLAEIRWPYWTEFVSFGRNLALFFSRKEEEPETIWCAEISMGRREGGYVWGKVEWCNPVVVGNIFSITRSLDVIV